MLLVLIYRLRILGLESLSNWLKFKVRFFDFLVYVFFLYYVGFVIWKWDKDWKD